jgi:hypothetical protein
VFFLGKAPKKILVFVIDEHDRTLTKESLHMLISELFEKVLDEQNVDAIVVNSPAVSTCAKLIGQIAGRDIADWEIIYFHGSDYPPVLLTYENKEKLAALLPEYKGTSAEAVYKVLADSGAYDKFE